MIVSDAIARIADDTSQNTNVAGVSARLLRQLNRVCSEYWDGYRWSWRWRNYRMVTDTDVTAGTVSLTNGSRTITGSGTAFTSTHLGWHINFPADSISNWYKINLVQSTTDIRMDVPYTGTTGSGKSYVLRHFDYTLPDESWDLANVTVTSDNRPVKVFEPMSIDLISPTPDYKGYPTAVSIYGSESTPKVYSTGTLSGSVDSQILNGSGTSWLDNVTPGDKVVIGQYSYTVRNVDSDTQITLYNYQQVTSSAGTTYLIRRQNSRILRVMWPSTNAYVLDIRALRKYAPLVANNDTNELLYRHANAVISAAAALEMKGADDKRAAQLIALSDGMMARARAEDEGTTPREHVQPVHSYRSGRYRSRIR